MASRATARAIERHDHLTHRGNNKHTRYGWLRLTPAFSVHLIQDLVKALPPGANVLDPFCGTGTTALVCAEEGIHAETTDINPFLLWLATAKTAAYSTTEIQEAKNSTAKISSELKMRNGHASWVPPLFQIEKWWDAPILRELGKIRALIEEDSKTTSSNASSLLKISFCRAMIELANVSFGHQSMSFKKPNGSVNGESGQMELILPSHDQTQYVTKKWQEASDSIIEAAQTPIQATPHCVYCDGRNLTSSLQRGFFECVITSPPYPNRMSYIRELRPYMYWLGYLEDARKAGELDWEAIGGTWGCATSNLMKWVPPNTHIPFSDFPSILRRIAGHSSLLSRYVHKYFCDMAVHVKELFQVVKPGGTIHYIVGNSKFYDTILPVEQIFASMFQEAGFEDVTWAVIRKRTSKRELFEYDVTGRKP
jgi:DNA modification methylase